MCNARTWHFVADSAAVFNLCETGKAEGIISVLTLCTVSYILRKFVPPGTMRTKLREFRSTLTPVDLSVSLLDKALASSLTDFEDAVQFYTAVYSEADYIITRNAKRFPTDHIPCLRQQTFWLWGNRK